MRIIKENDSILLGILLGATFPIIGYLATEAIFELLTQQGIMDEITASVSGKRQRTMALIAICFNILPLNFLNSRYTSKTLRGVLIVTFLFCFLWVGHFFLHLF